MIYDRTNVLSLQLRAMTNLRRLSRAEFFTRLQLIRTIDPITDEAYKIVEEKVWKDNLDDAPHGQPWHVSFHGSAFPGDNPMACPRKALYRMMNFPPAEPVSRKLRMTASQGKAVESELVRTWYEAEILLSSPDPDEQTGFEYPDAWLTSSVDAVLKPRGWNKPLPVEIKNRSAQVVAEMQTGRGPFPEHVAQIKAQIGFVRMYQEAGLLWSDLDPVTHGMIYYLSRDMPTNTAEFRIDYDHNFFVAGVERLKRWRAYFEEGLLPEINPGKRASRYGHPHGWRWSYEPCQFCNFKKTCQLDFREGRDQLRDSIGVDIAQKLRPSYDAESTILRVRARWTPTREPQPESV
jgi:CRISPR/Cas system-associated exonuclease Cas4 (RecB family)